MRFCGLKVAQIEGKLAGVVCGEGSAVGMLSVLGVAVSSAVLVGYGVWTRRTGRVPRAPRRALASWMGVSVLMLCLSAAAAFAQESGASAGTATEMDSSKDRKSVV